MSVSCWSICNCIFPKLADLFYWRFSAIPRWHGPGTLDRPSFDVRCFTLAWKRRRRRPQQQQQQPTSKGDGWVTAMRRRNQHHSLELSFDCRGQRRSVWRSTAAPGETRRRQQKVKKYHTDFEVVTSSNAKEKNKEILLFSNPPVAQIRRALSA